MHQVITVETGKEEDPHAVWFNINNPQDKQTLGSHVKPGNTGQELVPTARETQGYLCTR